MNADDDDAKHQASSAGRKDRPHVLLGVTGSVAAVKCPEIAVRLVKECRCHVRVLLTEGGANFWQKARSYNESWWDEFLQLTQDGVEGGDVIEVIHADDEWKQWNMMGDPVLHIDLRDWADLLLIAPLSAHTLAKLSQGLCDDTLSCVVRAWDFGHGSTTRRRPGKPLLLAPAMNTAMWDHPLTWQQLHAIQGFWNTEHDGRNGVGVITPMTKKLACGEVGQGALASVDTIIQQVRSVIS